MENPLVPRSDEGTLFTDDTDATPGEGLEVETVSASDREERPARPYVVGIGASAGGLEALERFFHGVPAKSAMAFVVVQHLSPDFKSFMGELLSRHTPLRIVRVEDNMAVEPNCIYLIPPKKNMLLQGGRLRLTDPDHSHGLNLPIDIFFRSLARDCGDHAVGIVLSGTGSDGTRGIRAIKEAGGIVIVQDEQSAKFDGMPKSAIATGLADYVLRPEEMASRLEHFTSQPRFASKDLIASALVTEEDKLAQIFTLLRGQHGLDFSLYKPKMVARRIERRMIINQVNDIDEYLALLHASREELRTLYNEFLIGVTKFFRDAEAFRRIGDEVIAKLLESTPAGQTIRAWIPACSTGEEAYSLAILFCERMEALGISREIKLYATDVDERAVHYASQGVYPESIAADLTRERLERFFTIKGEAYRVNPRLRQMVIFAPHDLTRDPPFTKLDLISCRNLLIYLRPDLQRRLLAHFHFALNPRGFLVLGASETVGELDEEFAAVDLKWRIYKKKRDIWLPTDSRLPPSMGVAPPAVPAATGVLRSRMAAADAAHSALYESLVEECLPPCMLVDARHQLLHAFGGAARYLKVPAGRATNDVLKMVHDDLAMLLATALYRAANQDAEVSYTNVQTRTGPNEVTVLKLRVKRFTQRRYEDAMFLVFLEEIAPAAPATSSEETFDATGIARQRINDLEHELRLTRENLQATIEELESSNEELQATNEEMLASNEELQSTNEELHSVNEELYAVNAEHQKKIAELIELNSDMDHLFHSTEIGTVFLDAELCVRKFTAAIAGKIHLLPQDIGRPIQHISHNLELDNLVDLVQAVMRDGKQVEQRVRDRAGNDLLMRVLPYRTADGTNDGVVLIFVDIQAVTRAERALVESRALLQSTLDALTAHIAILDENGVILSVNEAWHRFARDNGGDQRQGIGVNYLEVCAKALGADAEVAAAVAEGIRAVRDGHRAQFTLEYPCHEGQAERWFLIRVTRFTGGSNRVVVAHENITDRVLAERRTREALDRLEASRAEIARQAADLEQRHSALAEANRQLDEFAHVIAHDLKEPLQGMRVYAHRIRQELGASAVGPVHEHLVALEQQSLHMEDMITSLLEFARAGRLDPTRDTVDLGLALPRILESLEPLSSGAKVAFVVPRRLPTITGDRALIEVFRNLIANAIKYNDKPERRVEIGLQEPASDDEPTVFYVRDNGIGIRPNHANAVFQIFRRLHPRSRYGGGTGSGLSIAKRIIERHGGRIWMESTPGKGSTFYFTLGGTVLAAAPDPAIRE